MAKSTKPAMKKTAAKKAASKKSVAKKAAPKKAATKKVVPKKTTTKKSAPAKKTISKKAVSKEKIREPFELDAAATPRPEIETTSEAAQNEGAAPIPPELNAKPNDTLRKKAMPKGKLMNKPGLVQNTRMK